MELKKLYSCMNIEVKKCQSGLFFRVKGETNIILILAFMSDIGFKEDSGQSFLFF